MKHDIQNYSFFKSSLFVQITAVRFWRLVTMIFLSFLGGLNCSEDTVLCVCVCVGFLVYCLRECQRMVVSYCSPFQLSILCWGVGKISVHHPCEAISRTRYRHTSASNLVYDLQMLLSFPRSVPHMLLRMEIVVNSLPCHQCVCRYRLLLC